MKADYFMQRYYKSTIEQPAIGSKLREAEQTSQGKRSRDIDDSDDENQDQRRLKTQKLEQSKVIKWKKNKTNHEKTGCTCSRCPSFNTLGIPV